MSVTRISLFAGRTMKEVLRDPVNLFFGIVFPVGLLWALTLIYTSVGSIPGARSIGVDALAPAVASYAPVFLSLFAGMLLARDRTSSFLARLFASPMTAGDFILGYVSPMLVVSIAQSLVTFLVAGLFGFHVTVHIWTATIAMVPVALMYTAIGLLCGSLVSDRAVGGICGAMLTTVSFILSGVTVPLEIMGPTFRAVVRSLPFYNAAQAAQAALRADGAAVWSHIWIVCVYMIAFLSAAIAVFTVRKHD